MTCASRVLSLAIVIAALAGRAGGVRLYVGPPPPADDRPYEERVLAARDPEGRESSGRRTTRTHRYLRPKRAVVPGFAYYPVQPEYRVPAALTEIRSNPPVVIALPNSAHQLEQKVKVGTLTFTLAGTPYALSAFAENAGNVQRLWVPFRDLTSGIETYGGGRYLDLDRTRDRSLRSRLQPRLSPVLRVRPELGLSLSAERESAAGRDPRR